jgi:hypothetical protein
METKATGSRPMTNNHKRGHGSAWNVAPVQGERVELAETADIAQSYCLQGLCSTAGGTVWDW